MYVADNFADAAIYRLTFMWNDCIQSTDVGCPGQGGDALTFLV